MVVCSFQELDLSTSVLIGGESPKEDLWDSMVEATLRKSNMRYIKVMMLSVYYDHVLSLYCLYVSTVLSLLYYVSTVLSVHY